MDRDGLGKRPRSPMNVPRDKRPRRQYRQDEEAPYSPDEERQQLASCSNTASLAGPSTSGMSSRAQLRAVRQGDERVQSVARRLAEHGDVFGHAYMRDSTIRSPQPSPPRTPVNFPGLFSPEFSGSQAIRNDDPEIDEICNQFMHVSVDQSGRQQRARPLTQTNSPRPIRSPTRRSRSTMPEIAPARPDRLSSRPPLLTSQQATPPWPDYPLAQHPPPTTQPDDPWASSMLIAQPLVDLLQSSHTSLSDSWLFPIPDPWAENWQNPPPPWTPTPSLPQWRSDWEDLCRDTETFNDASPYLPTGGLPDPRSPPPSYYSLFSSPTPLHMPQNQPVVHQPPVGTARSQTPSPSHNTAQSSAQPSAPRRAHFQSSESSDGDDEGVRIHRPKRHRGV